MLRIRVESFSEIFEVIDALKTHTERVEELKKIPTAMVEFLKWTFDPSIKIQINAGELKYRPMPYHDGLESFMYRNIRNFYIFLGEITIKKIQAFERMLESVSARDALLLIGMVNKKLPYLHINLKLVSEAFPDMFPKSLDFAEAIQDSDILVLSKLAEPEYTNIPVPKIKTEYICPMCEKSTKTFGSMIMHLKAGHKITNDQLDEYRQKIKLEREHETHN